MIQTSGDANQHSLWTSGNGLGAKFTMAAWPYEQNSQQLSQAVIVNPDNAAMCADTVLLIAARRSQPS
ncbi:hypothetical protein [Leptothrix discophora]|uniref:Uncharacterized protein n=1 Tax=Leptothrix discophora TaxID=89 RepID=A0ABT9G861_LEPDI|nr:hypothetical protein [Leptothrix discophora]MDP4302662.1 hypothetical protein [Leptothrix discophora]